MPYLMFGGGSLELFSGHGEPWRRKGGGCHILCLGGPWNCLVDMGSLGDEKAGDAISYVWGVPGIV